MVFFSLFTLDFFTFISIQLGIITVLKIAGQISISQL
jgi:hypothetical protein